MTEEQDPKIIIDDDWKSQVEAEKETLQKELENEQSGEAEPGEMPPASISVLISTLASQAMVMMGHIPDPATGQPVVNKPLAKHFVDTLVVLEEKTKGNLTEDESAMLTEVIHQLRIGFVNIQEPGADPDSQPSSSIELP